jgi:hypothetical protein
VPEPENGGLYLLRKESASERLPSVLIPVLQQPANNTALTTDPILALDPRGLSDFGLRLTLGEAISTPNTLFSSPAAYACLAMGFPQLEFSANEVIAWPRPPMAAAQQRPRQPDVRGPSARYGENSGWGVGSPNSDDWRKSVALCLLCGVNYSKLATNARFVLTFTFCHETY